MSLDSIQVISAPRPPTLFKSTSSVPLTEFTLFPQLTVELRLSIWNMAIIPSIVRFEPGGGKGPGILFANRESREQSRKHYSLCINMTPSQAYNPIHFAPFGAFINYVVDILHVTAMVYTDDPNNYRGHDEPGYLNHNAIGHAITDFQCWLYPVRSIVLDVEDFRSLPGGRDEPHLLASIAALSKMCPTLKQDCSCSEKFIRASIS
jgi:2EXR family